MDEWVSFDALGEAQSQLLGAVHTLQTELRPHGLHTAHCLALAYQRRGSFLKSLHGKTAVNFPFRPGAISRCFLDGPGGSVKVLPREAWYFPCPAGWVLRNPVQLSDTQFALCLQIGSSPQKQLAVEKPGLMSIFLPTACLNFFPIIFFFSFLKKEKKGGKEIWGRKTCKWKKPLCFPN